MHAIFFAYGMKDKVDYFLEGLKHLCLPITFYKKVGGKVVEKKSFPIQTQIRTLPFGIYEFVFPKENMDVVLTTLRFNQKPPYNLDKTIMGIKPLKLLKNFLRVEDAPKFNTTHILPLIMQHVAIIPLGVRHDGEIEELIGPNKGWTHEAI